MYETIANLDVGETFSRSERMDFDNLTKERLAGAMDMLRNRLQNPVNRARSKLGYEYIVEVGEWRTQRDKEIIITAVATRVH